MLVTLKGEVFYKNGKIIGGKNNTTAHISRPRQMKDLVEKLEKVSPQLDELEDSIIEKQREYEALLNTIKLKTDEKRQFESDRSKANSIYQNVSVQHEKIIRQLEWSKTQRSTLNPGK